MPDSILDRSDITELTVAAARETVFFSRVDGRLCQWVELDLAWSGWRAALTVEIAARGKRESTEVALFGGGPVTVRCPAPALWPGGPDTGARLRIRHGKRLAEGTITVGTHRPWTVYLLSDLCADDTWAYGDLAAHDRDDYLTTIEELNAGDDNRYNFATAYQAERFWRQASAPERRLLREALRSGRVYMTPVPNQLLCGAFDLAGYPLLLEPYRRHWARAGGMPEAVSRDAYHMEAPTWTNGLVNLLACAGFRSFGKSMLAYATHAPWVQTLKKLPRLTRLEAAPGRYVWLLMRCGDYSEGMPVLAGLPHAEQFLHERVIPAHEALGDAYPTSGIPLIGAYSDLFPAAPQWTRAKVRSVRDYAARRWEYPKLLNATWTEFFDHVERDLGPARKPKRRGVRTVRGDTGACWEAWMLRIQQEHARFRGAQRDVVSLRTLCAMLGRRDARTLRHLEEATLELVNLGDHAWNGSSPDSKVLNLAVRRGRLERIEAVVGEMRSRLASGGRPAVVNTLGWRRACTARAADGLIVVPDVPAFGVRDLGVRAHVPPTAARSPLAQEAMRPALLAGGDEVQALGGWGDAGHGAWEVGPFAVSATLAQAAWGDATELGVDVRGRPPEGSYALRWTFDLPWKRCAWRAESGGGFVTPGADSLLGVCGSNIAVGGGLSAISPGGRGCVDFAFDESGICGLGGPTTELAACDPHGRLADSYRPDGRMRGRTTRGVLEWYLLTTDPLPHEAIPDQGGAWRWTFRCAFRRRTGGPDDEALYRFAAEFLRPGEVVSRRNAARIGDPWLHVDGKSVLVLGAMPRAKGLHMDLYNTSARSVTVRLRGRALEGRSLALSDMLERRRRPLRGGRAELAPLEFVRLIVE